MNNNIEVKQYFLKGVVDRFEGKRAVLRTDDGQELLWPQENLPKDVCEGQVIRLILTSSQNNEEERKRIAKKLLDEILETRGE